MTTIPLSRVISYLRRKDVGIECLEGAPYIGQDHRSEPVFGAIEPDLVPRIARDQWAPLFLSPALYLGTYAVCPAAMGWATVVLGTSVNSQDTYWIPGPKRRPMIILGGCPELSYCWADDCLSPERLIDRESVAVYLPAPMPPTPAARLLAALEYEMERP